MSSRHASFVRGMGPMSSTASIWLLIIILAVATGAVLSGIAAVLTAPLPETPSVDRSSAVVWAFYDAANHALQTGETASLDALLADEMVEHHPPPGLPTFKEQPYPPNSRAPRNQSYMTLVVEEVLASGDIASTRVHVEGSEQGVFLGLPVGEDRAPWGPLDQFWVVDGRIVEHWGSATRPPCSSRCSTRRLPSGSRLRNSSPWNDSRSRSVLKAGTPEHRRECGSSTWRPGLSPFSSTRIPPGPGLLSAAAGSASAGPPEQIAPGKQGILWPGDLLALPMATGLEIINTASVTVEAVVVTSRSADRPSDEMSWQDFGLLPGLDPATSVTPKLRHRLSHSAAPPWRREGRCCWRRRPV